MNGAQDERNQLPEKKMLNKKTNNGYRPAPAWWPFGKLRVNDVNHQNKNHTQYNFAYPSLLGQNAFFQKQAAE